MELILFAIALCLLAIWFGIRNTNCPPGPYSFPIIGSTIQLALADPKYPQYALAKLTKRYGDVMSFGLGVHDAVVISSHKLIKEVFNSPTIVSRYAVPYMTDRNLGRTDLGIAFSNNLDMKKYFLRKLTELGYRTDTVINPIIQQAAGDIVSAVKKQRDETTGSWSFDQLTFQAGTFNCVWAFAAGVKFDAADPLLLNAARATEKALEAFALNNPYVPFPFLRKLFPVKTGYVEHMKAYKAHQDAVKAVIQRYKERRGKDRTADTFVGCFLNDVEEGKEGFTEEQLMIILTDFMVGSTETSATVMSWTLLYLATHPEVQEIMYRDILKVVGDKGPPSLAQAAELPFVKAFFYEVFRITSFVPLSLPCKPSKDLLVNGYKVKKGSFLVFNTAAVHHDKATWVDPENFRPQRFIQETEEGGKRLVGTEGVIGFGIGKRLCPGEQIGWDILFMFLATLVQNYEFGTIAGMEPSFEPVVRAVMSPQKYTLRVTPRK